MAESSLITREAELYPGKYKGIKRFIPTFSFEVGMIYLPFANKVFHTQPLSLFELLACIGISAIVFHTVELEKWIRWRSTNKRPWAHMMAIIESNDRGLCQGWPHRIS